MVNRLPELVVKVAVAMAGLVLEEKMEQQTQVAVVEADYLKGWADGHDEWDRLIGSRQKAGQ